MEEDKIKAAIEAKIFASIKPSNWKTLKVATMMDSDGMLVAAGFTTGLPARLYRVTVKEIVERKRKAKK